MQKKDLHHPFKCIFSIAILFSVFLILSSCGSNVRPADEEIVEMPEKMDIKVADLIKENINYLESRNGKLNDSIQLFQLPELSVLYNENKFSAFWSKEKVWLSQGVSMLKFLEHIELYGLFPQDYHADVLKNINDLFHTDSLELHDKKNAVLWARADVLLSDAFVNIIQDLKLGRLPKDSITMRKDTVLTAQYVSAKFNAIISGLNFDSVISTLEPRYKGYQVLKAGISQFLKKADFRDISQINFPETNKALLKTSVINRLVELGFMDTASHEIDSLSLAKILIKFQRENGLTDDGKIGAQTIRELNLSDIEKFKRIAITLDRYKMLPDSLPSEYIWVNIPSFNLKLIRHDSIIINSRVVVGKPLTRSPVLTSSIYEIVTYPQWSIPQSIIEKEILPAVKKNAGYLAKKGYGIFDIKGNEIDPYSVDWTKYKKTIPYRVIQGSGDDNALGILKFNFRNNYSVYLHDTNQRFYFGLASRALSHGCIRVQEWNKMAFYILDREVELQKNKTGNKLSLDSVKYWLANKEKHNVPIANKMPVFIRYFTCEGVDGHVIFYEDIYNEDKDLAEKLFHNKKLG